MPHERKNEAPVEVILVGILVNDRPVAVKREISVRVNLGEGQEPLPSFLGLSRFVLVVDKGKRCRRPKATGMERRHQRNEGRQKQFLVGFVQGINSLILNRFET